MEYLLDHGTLPPGEKWVEALRLDPLFSYAPWRSRYLLRHRPGHDGYTILSAGADGEVGTADDQVYGDELSYQRCREGSSIAIMYRRLRELVRTWLGFPI